MIDKILTVRCKNGWAEYGRVNAVDGNLT